MLAARATIRSAANFANPIFVYAGDGNDTISSTSEETNMTAEGGLGDDTFRPSELR